MGKISSTKWSGSNIVGYKYMADVMDSQRDLGGIQMTNQTPIDYFKKLMWSYGSINLIYDNVSLTSKKNIQEYMNKMDFEDK